MNISGVKVRSIISMSAVLFLFLMTAEAGKNGTPKTILVSAAASLADVVTDIARQFEKENDLEVKTNFASSGTLARQIAQGLVPDVYLSANRKWMNHVDSLGYVDSKSITVIAKNKLVLIAPMKNSPDELTIEPSLDLSGMIGTERLSMGDPSHVPAGKYAAEALAFFGWESVAATQMLPAKDVRSALMVVELGECLLGIVYMTDALKSKKVKVLAIFPEESHSPVVYVAGVCSRNESAEAFQKFLLSESANETWIKYGFNR
ncbi:MAG: molybdate ABC transporter substrate-binding protein [Candidatus Pacearchaeota archaeon]|nr:molybdate ABC transporter substrate-binding protein [Candidatus Pacearchaeota archaeon]